ncbi:MAG: hypothetical protein WC783_03420 [Candidatus Paceibacterota bacterium]|jgi:hypothetical protein
MNNNFTVDGITVDGITVPPITKQAIDDYVKKGVNPGSFIKAILTNNLREAVTLADTENLAALKATVYYVYNEVPYGAYNINKWEGEK